MNKELQQALQDASDAAQRRIGGPHLQAAFDAVFGETAPDIQSQAYQDLYGILAATAEAHARLLAFIRELRRKKVKEDDRRGLISEILWNFNFLGQYRAINDELKRAMPSKKDMHKY